MTIDNAWALGKPEILNALASRLRTANKIEKDWVEGGGIRHERAA
jgi:hypothetical protein